LDEIEHADPGRRGGAGGVQIEGFRAGGPLRGPIRLPGSKSLAQRALVCAALCGDLTRIERPGSSDDVLALARALIGLGVVVEGIGSASLSIRGCPPGPGVGLHAGAGESVSIGESGTAGRLLMAASALCGRLGGQIVLEAEGSLRSRSSPALYESLRAAGAGLTGVSPGRPQLEGWPVRIEPVGPPSSLRLVGPRSSQELSALLIACAAWPGEFEVNCDGALPSAPYVDMTCTVLRAFGVSVERTAQPAAGGSTWLVRGPLRPPAQSYPAQSYTVEPDASAAAVALAAACLSGGELTLPGLGPDSPQGDVRIAAHLRAFGCHATLSKAGLSARGAPTRGADLDLQGEPDLAPVLAAVAAGAALTHGHASRLTGLGTLPGKESGRIEVLAAGLGRIGLEASAGADYLTIAPGSPAARRAGPIELDSHGDHRMAFCFGLLGLLVPGVGVRTPECVAKSWPGFWTDMQAAGLKALHPA
jgi:3-phosphoshikimate 1-carboxyvinyltransferase